jgi:HD-like signal output (HDOD) protein
MTYHPQEEPATPRTLEDNIGIAIRDIGIPPRPSVLIEIEAEMRKDEPDFSHLAKIISADVALSAGLLKTCNSPFFGLDKKVRSVPEALLVLGLNLTIRTVAGVALRKAFERAPHLERFWDESGTTARVSGWLARRLRKCCWVRPEDAYTFGLFHDCGIPILVGPFPQYRAVLAQANTEQDRRFTDIENQAIGCNHADMGALLAESWSLPQEIVEAVRHHHQLNELVAGTVPMSAPIVAPLIAITQLAEYLIYTRTGSGSTFEWQKMSAAAMRVLSIDEAKIAELFEECHEPISGLYD